MKSFLIVFAALIISWDLVWWLLGVPPLFPWQLRQTLHDQPDTILLDVRTSAEYHWFHIPGARLVPDLSNVTASLAPGDRTRPLVIICMTGHRSPFVAYHLKNLGYERVRNLSWGTLGWLLYSKLTRVWTAGQPQNPTGT